MTEKGGNPSQPIGETGFTLLELLAVVILLTMVANFSLNSFMRMSERERVQKAQAKLTMICHAEHIYRKDWATYANRIQLITDYCPEPDASEYAYAISLVPPDFTATATRLWGPYQNSTVSVSSTDPNCSTYTYGGNYDVSGNPSVNLIAI